MNELFYEVLFHFHFGGSNDEFFKQRSHAEDCTQIVKNQRHTATLGDRQIEVGGLEEVSEATGNKSPKPQSSSSQVKGLNRNVCMVLRKRSEKTLK